MIFLGNLEQIKDNKYKAFLVAQDVKERADKRNLTVEEFSHHVLESKTGLVVEKLPITELIEGKAAIICVDLDTKEAYYEYEDIPQTEEDKIGFLEKQVADLTFMIMQMQGGTN